MKATLNDLLSAKGVSEPLREAVKALIERLEAAESDAIEQARLNGMGASREAALMAKLEAAERERDNANAAAAGIALKAEKLEEERDALRAENETLAANLRGKHSTAGATYAHLIAERDALRAEVQTWKQQSESYWEKIAAMEKQEPVAWCATDETGTVIEALGMNQSRRFDTALYLAPGAQPAPSVPECPYPCGWRNLLEHAIKDGAYLARHINEDEPVTESARSVTMRMVLRLRDVLMALNNAAPEAKP